MKIWIWIIERPIIACGLLVYSILGALARVLEYFTEIGQFVLYLWPDTLMLVLQDFLADQYIPWVLAAAYILGLALIFPILVFSQNRWGHRWPEYAEAWRPATGIVWVTFFVFQLSLQYVGHELGWRVGI